jgi:hypothetical protein
MTPETTTEREWLRQWIGAGTALAAKRREELLHLSDERALAASEALLSSQPSFCFERRRWSGSWTSSFLHRRPSP